MVSSSGVSSLIESALVIKHWSCRIRLCTCCHVPLMIGFEAHLLGSATERFFGAPSQDSIDVIWRLGRRQISGVKNGWRVYTLSSGANRSTQSWHLSLGILFGFLHVILLPVIEPELFDPWSDDLNSFRCADGTLDEALLFQIAALIITQLPGSLISNFLRIFIVVFPDDASGKLPFSN